MTLPGGATRQVGPGSIIIEFPAANSIVEGIDVLANGNAQTSSGFGGFTAAQTNTGPQGLSTPSAATAR